MSVTPIKVTFLAHSLRLGGTEVQLSALASGIDRQRFAPSIVCIHGDGELMQVVRDAGIPVTVVGKRGRYDALALFGRIVRALRSYGPDVVYSYLDLPNVIAGLAKPFLRGSRVVWGVRAADMHLSERGLDWRVIFALQRMLANRADAIVCNSWAGRMHLEASGFPVDAMVVQPNGFDCDRHMPDDNARLRLRAELGLKETEIVVGMVGRLDPVKDHKTFLRAAARLAPDHRNLRFVCVGGGDEGFAQELKAFAASLGLSDRVLWTGSRADVPALYNAFDISTLTSYTEGFPNVVGEAMASGLPCVVTDVGDAARIVGDVGVVVPIGDAEALADGWRSLAMLSAVERKARGTLARERVVREFPLRAMRAGSESILRAVVEGQAIPRSADARQVS